MDFVYRLGRRICGIEDVVPIGVRAVGGGWVYVQRVGRRAERRTINGHAHQTVDSSSPVGSPFHMLAVRFPLARVRDFTKTGTPSATEARKPEKFALQMLSHRRGCG